MDLGAFAGHCYANVTVSLMFDLLDSGDTIKRFMSE